LKELVEIHTTGQPGAVIFQGRAFQGRVKESRQDPAR
jgi:hypothetical protein